VNDTANVDSTHRWAHNFKNVALQSKTQFVNQERNTQHAIALLNYFKRIASQQLMLRMQIFTIIIFKAPLFN
jgi:hypothetical protein